MNRRDFLRRAAIVTGAGLVADKLELLERFAPRSLFASIDMPQMATISFTQTNARYGFDGYATLESLLVTGHENLIPIDQWAPGLIDVQRTATLHELRTFTVPEWRAGRWSTPYRRRREPRFVRELRALVESPLPDVALDPRRRPRFMREFDRLWQNGPG